MNIPAKISAEILLNNSRIKRLSSKEWSGYKHNSYSTNRYKTEELNIGQYELPEHNDTTLTWSASGLQDVAHTVML